jgi:hypothetical protein
MEEIDVKGYVSDLTYDLQSVFAAGSRGGFARLLLISS